MSSTQANGGEQRQHFKVERLTKVFSTDEGEVTAVDDVSFAIEGETFFTMLGPSGCGKTTTLRMIAGLEAVTSGRIERDGADFRRMNAFERNIGMVFQSYALFPHLTVFENAAYGLRLRRAREADVKAAVTRVLSMLRLDGLAHRYPADLSGGQQQRVSIARALVYEPGMLLLDEPLANLDAKLRVEMREEIRRLQKSLGITALYVTHDQEEAMAVSDIVGVFNRGRLIQIGRPYDIYANPTSLFVADFIGKANFFPVRAERTIEQAVSARVRGGAIFSGVALKDAAKGEDDWFDGDAPLMLMVRPERMWLAAPDGAEAGPALSGTAQRVQFLGTFVRYIIDTRESDRPVIIDRPAFVEGIGEGSRVAFGFTPDAATAYGRPQ
jgi:iron(III) transport system ATP-binding protein